MRAVTDAAFLREPRDAFVVGRQWVYGSPDGKLYFSIVHGVIDEAAANALLALWQVELTTRGHRSLCDARALVTITPTAFLRLTEFMTMTSHRDALATRIERQALILPEGMTGATVAGYYRVYPPAYPYHLCEARDEALAWLGYPVATLAQTVVHANEDPLLRALRQQLANGTRPSLAIAASTLGASTRSLQRQLAALGTSYARELRCVQIARAMALLATTDDKLATIATAVGCASLTSFTELFTREVGLPPSRWRSAQQRRD